MELEHGRESLEASDALDLLVDDLLRGGQGTRKETRELAERAVQIREKQLPPEDTRLASSRINLAQVLISLGESREARPLLELALKVRTRLLGSENLEVAAVTSMLGGVVNNVGEHEEARVLHEHALEVRERLLPENDPIVAESLNNLANVLMDLGDYEAARRNFLRAADVYQNAPGIQGRPPLDLVWNNLARLEHEMGEFAAARSYFERAAAIQFNAFGPMHRRLGQTLSFLGLTLQAMGDLGSARDSLERALQVRVGALGRDHVLVSTTMFLLAGVYKEAGLSERAESLYRAAMDIRLRKTGPNDANYADMLQGLADVLVQSGRAGQADSLGSQAVRIIEEIYGSKHHMVAQALVKGAGFRLRAGDLRGARSYVDRALAIQNEVLGPEHPDFAEAEILRSRILLRQGDSLASLQDALHGERIARAHSQRIGRSLTESEALRFAEVRSNGLGSALRLAERGLPAGLTDSLFDGVLRSRALVLDEMAARRRALPVGNDSTSRHLYASLGSASRRLANLILRGADDAHPGRFRAELAEARQRLDSVERALADHSARFRSEQAASTVGLREVASSLPEGSALLAYVRYGSREPDAAEGAVGTGTYGGFVLDPATGSTRFVYLGSADGIERSITVWRAQVARGAGGRGAQEGERESRRLGEQVRRQIWDAVAPALHGVKRLFVVPDGAIGLIPFAALPRRGEGYLIDSNPWFHYLSAERDLVVDVGRSAANSGLLALGGIQFTRASSTPPRTSDGGGGVPGDRDRTESAPGTFRGQTPNCQEFRSIRFQSLPATKREVGDLVSVWRSRSPIPLGRHSAETTDGGTVTSLVGSEATEAAFKRLAMRFGTLHLATHGFFLEGNCHSSWAGARGFDALVPESTISKRPRKPDRPQNASSALQDAAENPLLLSGLALAGANDRGPGNGNEEDGILTAEEIAAMDLSGVRWAVLSACDTGVGRATSGEGLLGLRRAFQIAGVKTLVMSLWPLEDRAARMWMRRLYRARLVEGLDSADAVREASRSVLAHRRSTRQSTHPIYWGGLVAAGDWR
jgi:CHAT domain-containing protein/tetratricopeptide (TPR) repeat protein